MRIVAEIGSNFRDLDDCLAAIEKAASCGAHAVKFQLFSKRCLYGIPDDGFNLPPEWLPQLKAHAAEHGVKLMCTAFSERGLALVDPYVETHKVASAEITHLELLRAVAATGKPVYLSTGASTLEDIRAAVHILRKSEVTLLYCVAAYPARETDLRMIERLGAEFPNLDVGLSDHSVEVISIPVTAKECYGITVLEKHVNFLPPDVRTPDSPHSLNEAQFHMMCKALRGADRDEYSAMPEETEMFARHNRRMVATGPIAEGEPLEYGRNYGYFRLHK